MPKFFIVEQLVNVGTPQAPDMQPRPVKTVGNAPNENGQTNEAGDVPAFIRIPPIIRLYIGADSWGSPEIMPTHEEMQETGVRPVVHTLTLNPRTGNINWHAGLGKGERLEVCPRTGERKIETMKPVSGTALTMPHKLAPTIGLPLAVAAVSLMVAEWDALKEKQAKAAEKRAEKGEGKPRKVRSAPIDERAAAKAAIDAAKRKREDERRAADLAAIAALRAAS